MPTGKAPPWFTEAAEALMPGCSYRESPPVVVSRSDDGLRWFRYDYRDPDAASCHRPQLSTAVRLHLLSERKKAQTAVLRSPYLPEGLDPFSPRFSTAARVWLLKAGFHAERAAALGILYHPKMDRVILPFTTLSGVNSWTARRMGDDGPKYFGPSTRGLGPAVMGSRTWVTDKVLVTEDLLSAWHVHEHTGLTTVCALGVSLSVLNLAHLQHAGMKRLYVWLDPDAAGQRGATYIRGLAERLDIGVRIIGRHTVDPKYIPAAEIGGYIEP